MTFFFDHGPEDSSAEDPAGAASSGELRPATVLVCDDEPTVLRVVGALLRRSGFTVLEAANGSDALRVANDKVVDLLLTDVAMPGMDGLQLVKEIRTAHPDLPVLLFTGNADDARVINGARDIGVEVLEKPVPSTVLLDRIRDVLDL